MHRIGSFIGPFVKHCIIMLILAAKVGPKENKSGFLKCPKRIKLFTHRLIYTYKLDNSKLSNEYRGYVDTDMLPGSYPHRKYIVCMV